MRVVWGADRQVADWVAVHIEDAHNGFGECRAAAVFDGERNMVAGVVFHDWSPERGLIELSAAAVDRRWLTRGVASEIMGYAFSVARMAVARTSERNKPVRRIWRAMGAAEHIIPDLWADGEAGVILTLKENAFRASRLGVKHEQA